MNRMATKTLAEIYFRQGHLREAYEMFKALSEKDPGDVEIQKCLKELGEKLDFSSPSAVEERISTLKDWLAAIQARRKK